ncbi:Cytoskeletal signaling protein [Lachnellula hyalina]|uniref:Cytoskeletal signaling protein n=1 Tax=Lachnellula hyalina TaxID=1316788 RepID=A0A8H8U588_9HELO|nr:Cytoskeletal signaling protein [Lachnellula hyalina]TVY30974.1 Cytoskeletal signaling protein [Lachnellula hyalina]
MSTEKAGLPGSHPVTMPNRQVSTSSVMSDDAAIPSTDPKDTTGLLAERLQAWKHAVGYLEDYIGAIEKANKAHGKEYEKVLKTIQNPLREGHHFDQSLGGMAGLFENMRQNTQVRCDHSFLYKHTLMDPQGVINTHLETEKNLKGSVLPILERLHKEIKNKSKELASGAGKSAKEVEKARNTTQKHIELLGQQTANFESSGGKMTAAEDPYVVQRGVFHRLATQIIHENNNRHDLIAVQNNFAQFEQHVIEVIQAALESFNQFVGGQAQKEQQLYADILGTAQCIPFDFEWTQFVQRSGNLLVDPNGSERTIDGVAFANHDHKSTKPLIEGTLERKSRNKLSLSGYSTGYYVVTPSKYLHEFKDNEYLKKDPVPEMSIYLPDATIGTTSGEKFNVKGKDVSKGIGSKLSGSSEISFKGHTASDAQKWSEVIRSSAAAAGPSAAYSGSTPTSPVSPDEKRVNSFPPQYSAGSSPDTKAGPAPIQTTGVIGGSTVTSPVAATPTSAAEKM